MGELVVMLCIVGDFNTPVGGAKQGEERVLVDMDGE